MCLRNSYYALSPSFFAPPRFLKLISSRLRLILMGVCFPYLGLLLLCNTAGGSSHYVHLAGVAPPPDLERHVEFEKLQWLRKMV